MISNFSFSFADVSNISVTSNNFSSSSASEYTVCDSFSGGYLAYAATPVGYNQYSDTSVIFAFVCSGNIYFCSSSSSSVLIGQFTDPSSYSFGGSFRPVYNSTYDIYLNNRTLYGTSDLPSFNTIQEGVDYFKNYVPAPTTTYNYTMQNGWLSVIDLGSSGASYDLTLNTTFAEYSSLSSPYWNSTQRYWFTNTMPSEGDSFNDSAGTVIDWDKTGNTDLFGRSKNAVSTLSGTSTGRYLIIYNPAYHKVTSWMKGGATLAVENNLPVTIDGINEGTVVTLFKMNSDESILTGSITSTFNSSGATATASGSAINITDSFTDSDGNTVIQNSGGSNDLHESGGIVGYIVQLSDMLDNFTNSILQLLTAPISHIQQLLSSSGTFFESISGLWSWMPSEISGFIISAFVIMVAISIFKLFL